MPTSSRAERLMQWPSYPLGVLHREANARFRAAFAEAGLSLATHAVLACLADYGKVSQQQVSDLLEVDRSEIVKRVDRLEEQGQVERRADPEDRRRHLLALTSEGRRALRRGERLSRKVTAGVFERLDEKELRTLHRLTLKALGAPTAIAGRR